MSLRPKYGLAIQNITFYWIMNITSNDDDKASGPNESRLAEENHELHFVAEDRVDKFKWIVEEEKTIVKRGFEILRENGCL